MFPLRDSARTRRFPFVNYLLILANVLIFIKELQISHLGGLESFLMTYGLVPSRLLENPFSQWPSVFSSMFLHGGWGHVISNMWFLHVFGDNVEDNLGHIRYFFYYLLMGVSAALTQVAAAPQSHLPMIGASGAVAGVLGGYFVLHPGARVLTLVPIFIFIRLVEIPAFFFLGLWFVIQAFNSVGSLSVSAVRGDVGGVAWWAHAGGFVAGFTGILFFRKRR